VVWFLSAPQKAWWLAAKQSKLSLAANYC